MVPNYLAQVRTARDQYPEAWRSAHVSGDPKAWDFSRLLARDLHAIDPRIGLNGKRGNPNDLSMDALNFRGEGPGYDPVNGNTPITVIDVITGAGGPNPQPGWLVFSELAGPGVWVQPDRFSVPTPPVPPLPLAPAPAPVDLTPILQQLHHLKTTLETLQDRILTIQVTVAALQTPPPPKAPIYTGRVFGQTVTLRPNP